MINLTELTPEARKQYDLLSEEDKKQFEQFNKDEQLTFNRLSENMSESSLKLYKDYLAYYNQHAGHQAEPMTFEEYDRICTENRAIAQKELSQMFALEAQFARTKRLLDETVRDALLSEDLQKRDKELLWKYSRGPIVHFNKKDKEKER